MQLNYNPSVEATLASVEMEQDAGGLWLLMVL